MDGQLAPGQTAEAFLEELEFVADDAIGREIIRELPACEAPIDSAL